MRTSIVLVSLVLSGCFVSLKAPIPCSVPESIDPVGKDKYTILLYGDFGSGEKESSPNYVVGRAMAKVCADRKCDFALGTGDNFYSRGVSSAQDRQFQTKFEIPYRDLRFPHYQSLGNHDYLGNPRAQIEYKSEKWRMDCAYYPVRSLPSWLTIFALDTNKLTKPQLAQFKSVMCGKTGWKVAFGHHPLYSSGEHGDTGEMKDKVLPILKECGTQFLISGHDHDQEHISDGELEQIVQGAAGKTRDISRRDIPPAQKFAAAKYGFGVLEVTRDSALVDFYDDNGAVIYRFTRGHQ